MPPGNPAPHRETLSCNGLKKLYRLFSYFARWNAQTQERAVRLSF